MKRINPTSKKESFDHLGMIFGEKYEIIKKYDQISELTGYINSLHILHYLHL